MNDGVSDTESVYSQEEIDALAYSYVLSHGYEGALSMLAELVANHYRHTATRDTAIVRLCRRILKAIDDEAATISRILDRMILTSYNGVRQDLAALSFPSSNPIDQHVGGRLRQRRVQLGLSLAMLAKELALPSELLSAIEDGTERLDAAQLNRASVRLSVSRAYFFEVAHADDEATVPRRHLKG